MVINMLGIEMKADTYYTDNTMYILGPFSQVWQKKTYLQPEYDELFADQSESILQEVNEPLCAGLTQIPGNSPDEMLLKGDAFLTELFKKALANQETGNSIAAEDMRFDTSYMEISLNSSTYLVKSIIMKLGSVRDADPAQTADKGTTITEVNVKIQYSD